MPPEISRRRSRATGDVAVANAGATDDTPNTETEFRRCSEDVWSLRHGRDRLERSTQRKHPNGNSPVPPPRKSGCSLGGDQGETLIKSVKCLPRSIVSDAGAPYG